MRYLVIGLGIYGANLARDLASMGHEVIGADASRATVDAIKDYITTAYVIDTTEESALGVLPLRNVDLVIVAIGENFGASVKTVALLKKAGVKNIYARAIDPLHESILESFNVARILRPEQRAAVDLTREMALGAEVESLAINDDYTVVRFAVPDFFVGLLYKDLDFEREYKLRLVAAFRPTESINVLGMKHIEPKLIDLSANPRVEEGDILTVFGSKAGFKNLYKKG